MLRNWCFYISISYDDYTLFIWVLLFPVSPFDSVCISEFSFSRHTVTRPLRYLVRAFRRFVASFSAENVNGVSLAITARQGGRARREQWRRCAGHRKLYPEAHPDSRQCWKRRDVVNSAHALSTKFKSTPFEKIARNKTSGFFAICNHHFQFLWSVIPKIRALFFPLLYFIHLLPV